MKKVLLTLLGIIVVVGVLAGAGFAGYRIGYRQGTRTNVDQLAPRLNRLPQFNQNEKPQPQPGMNDRNFNRGFGADHFQMMQRGRGFGFFSPFQFLFRLVIIGLIIWLGYKLFTGNGWQLSLTRHSVKPPIAEPAAKSDE